MYIVPKSYWEQRAFITDRAVEKLTSIMLVDASTKKVELIMELRQVIALEIDDITDVSEG